MHHQVQSYVCRIYIRNFVVLFLFVFQFLSRGELGHEKYKRKKRRELSPEQKQEIKEAFDLFDTDKDQRIDYHELKVIMIHFLDLYS